jgi:glutamate synthase domain-containing protein 2
MVENQLVLQLQEVEEEEQVLVKLMVGTDAGNIGIGGDGLASSITGSSVTRGGGGGGSSGNSIY